MVTAVIVLVCCSLVSTVPSARVWAAAAAAAGPSPGMSSASSASASSSSSSGNGLAGSIASLDDGGSNIASNVGASSAVHGLGLDASGAGGHSSGSGGPMLSSRVVHTKYGAVSGVIVQLEARNLDPVEAFKGVPYASPPIGNLRFMPPVTGALWSGVKKADR